MTAFTFSVIIPSFNRAHCLPRAIASALDGHDAADEVVVVDDGSRDGTDVLVAELAAASKRPIRYLNLGTNKGVSVARNRGAEFATGDFLIFLDSDDCLLPGAVGRFRAALQAQPELDMVFGGRLTRLPRGRKRGQSPLPLSEDRWKNFADELTSRRATPGIGTSAIRRSAVLRFPFFENLSIAEDTVFYARQMLHGRCACFSDLQVDIDQTTHHQVKYLDQLFEQQSLAFTLALEGLPDSPALAKLRRDIAPLPWLRTFRELHRSGFNMRAGAYYLGALRHYPRQALHISHLRKFMRCLIGLRHPASYPRFQGLQ